MNDSSHGQPHDQDGHDFNGLNEHGSNGHGSNGSGRVGGAAQGAAKSAAKSDALVPALQPVARLLIVTETEVERSIGFGHRAQRALTSASVMKRVADIAETAGHHVMIAPTPAALEHEAPEVILLDGGSRHAVELIEAAQRDEFSPGAAILMVTPARARDGLLEALRAAGADEFLGAEAQSFEILARLEAATMLFRARAEIAALRHQIGRQIRVDDLTGVMSRRFFFQQAHRECSRARRYGSRLSCVMLEIDHFKNIVATFGEGAGEAVLRSAANIIGQWTRDSDLVARFTEAKFAVMLPETGIDGATRAQDKITIALANHVWKFDGHILPVTVSIGESELQPGAPFSRVADDYISEGDESGDAALSTRESLAGLLEDADAALYVARRGARMPDVFVPYTPVPTQDPAPKSSPRKRKSASNGHNGSHRNGSSN